MKPTIMGNKAKRAIAAYGGRPIRQHCQEDLRCTIIDLIADLIHYADDRHFDGVRVVETASMHARIEKRIAKGEYDEKRKAYARTLETHRKWNRRAS